MANLAHRPRAAAPMKASKASQSRVVLVREPSRQVRRIEETDRLPVHLAIGVIATLGGLMLLWLLGTIGYQLGFAALVGAPELTASPTAALATGVRQIMAAPLMIVRATMAEPMWLMIAFAMISIPGAGLSAARPQQKGTAKPTTFVVVMSAIGATVGMLTAIALLVWTSAPLRTDALAVLPADATQIGGWLDRLDVIAGFDVLAIAIAALWVVLMFRMPNPTWLRALGVSVMVLTMVVTLGGAAVSLGAAVEMRAPRTVVDMPDVNGDAVEPVLLLGHTARHHAVMSVHDFPAIRFEQGPELMIRRGAASVTEVARGAAAVRFADE